MTTIILLLLIPVGFISFYFYNGRHFCCRHDCTSKNSIRKIERKFNKCKKSDSFIKNGYIECAILKECCICHKKKWTFGHRDYDTAKAMKLPNFVDGED